VIYAELEVSAGPAKLVDGHVSPHAWHWRRRLSPLQELEKQTYRDRGRANAEFEPDRRQGQHCRDFFFSPPKKNQKGDCIGKCSIQEPDQAQVTACEDVGLVVFVQAGQVRSENQLSLGATGTHFVVTTFLVKASKSGKPAACDGRIRVNSRPGSPCGSGGSGANRGHSVAAQPHSTATDTAGRERRVTGLFLCWSMPRHSPHVPSGAVQDPERAASGLFSLRKGCGQASILMAMGSQTGGRTEIPLRASREAKLFAELKHLCAEERAGNAVAPSLRQSPPLTYPPQSRGIGVNHRIQFHANTTTTFFDCLAAGRPLLALFARP